MTYDERTSPVETILGRLDGGACLNQRSLGRVFQMFGPKTQSASATASDISVADLLDVLWTLDLMIAHKHVSYDGTLPDADLRQISSAADKFCEASDWERQSIMAVTPRSEEHQLAFQIDAALDMLDTPFEPIRELDQGVPTDQATTFFEALDAATSIDVEPDAAEPAARARLLELGKNRFRGSKCVAGLAGHGRDAAELAFALRDRLADPGLAVGLLINRFRFGYLRRLAWNAGDVYVPGTSWRRLSTENAKTFHQLLAQALGKKFFGRLQAELGGTDGASTTILPPVAIYCLIVANPAHGPSGVIDHAIALARDYRSTLQYMTRAVRDLQPSYSGWTQPTGINDIDRLNEQIESNLVQHLGEVDKVAARYRQANPPGYDRMFTYFTGISDQVIPGAAGGVVGAAAGQLFTIDPLAGLAAGALGGTFAAPLVDAIKTRGFPSARRAVYGHLDAYRSLDAYLGARDAPPRHLSALESKVREVLNLRLVQ